MANLAANSKGHFDYEIIDTIEVGMELLGPEVKSIRNKQVKLEGAYALIRGGEAFITGLYIAPYQAANKNAIFDSYRIRRLLIAKKELQELVGRMASGNLTLIPLSMYNKGRFIKLSLGLAKKKKKHDKRESIKKRDTDRDIRRSLTK
jgi:SsrA-binding protein